MTTSEVYIMPVGSEKVVERMNLTLLNKVSKAKIEHYKIELTD